MNDDLTWLARNVHAWREGASYICVDRTDGGYVFHEHNRNCATWFTRDQWLARRAELQNKPSWKDAPKLAMWLGQCSSGKWEWYDDEEAPPVHADGDCWGHQSFGKSSGKSGEVLGDWRDTLESRPESNEMNKDEREAAQLDDFDPLISVEDAPTPVTAHSILEQAGHHMRDRAATYDKPEGERSMGATVDAFRAVTGHKLTEEQGWLFMLLLKAVRSQQGAYRADSYEDGSAYTALAGEAAARERGGAQ